MHPALIIVIGICLAIALPCCIHEGRRFIHHVRDENTELLASRRAWNQEARREKQVQECALRHLRNFAVTQDMGRDQRTKLEVLLVRNYFPARRPKRGFVAEYCVDRTREWKRRLMGRDVETYDRNHWVEAHARAIGARVMDNEVAVFEEIFDRIDVPVYQPPLTAESTTTWETADDNARNAGASTGTNEMERGDTQPLQPPPPYAELSRASSMEQVGQILLPYRPPTSPLGQARRNEEVLNITRLEEELHRSPWTNAQTHHRTDAAGPGNSTLLRANTSPDLASRQAREWGRPPSVGANERTSIDVAASLNNASEALRRAQALIAEG